MMGTEDNKGIIPRLCDELFARIAALSHTDGNTSCKVEVSFMELYNEKVTSFLLVYNKISKIKMYNKHSLLYLF